MVMVWHVKTGKEATLHRLKVKHLFSRKPPPHRHLCNHNNRRRHPPPLLQLLLPHQHQRPPRILNPRFSRKLPLLLPQQRPLLRHSKSNQKWRRNRHPNQLSNHNKQ